MDEKLRVFVEELAKLMTEDETDGGYSWEEIAPVLSDLIQQARDLTGVNPGYEVVFCSACQMSIEVCGCCPNCLEHSDVWTCGEENTVVQNTVCPRCGAVVADQEAHRVWHRNWNDWELEDLATTLPAPFSSPN